MFRKILVPVDLTSRHAPAVEIAAGLAGPAGAEVTLLHVVEEIHGLEREEDRDFYADLERKAAEHMDQLLAAVSGGSVTGQRVILFGERVPELLRYAEQVQADLIVITSHALDPSRPGGGWGTTSHLIGIAARCPVLLVK
jgi:nucleotide-binding universal stress UspA family protein